MEKELLKKLKKDKILGFVEYKNLLEKAHSLLSENNESSYNSGLMIICYVADSKPSDLFIKQLLYDCIVESRIFLYGGMLERFQEDYFKDSNATFSLFSKSFYTLDSGTILTKDQKRLFDEFQKTKKLIVSAPTSFGKSRIIPEIIITNEYKNVAVILPTIALLNETYISFKNNAHLKSYTILNSLSQPLSRSKNILILTPEKMDLFLDQNPDFTLDFFVMDEIYKIQDDPERKQIFTHCLYQLSNKVPSFYLIGPYFEKFSEKFITKKQATFMKFNTEIVQKDVHYFNELANGTSFKMGEGTLTKVKTKEINLRKLTDIVSEQTFVYVGRKTKAESLSKIIANKRITKKDIELTNYIKENVAKDWSLVEGLEKGVAFHHSAMPRYIQREILDSFNEGGLDLIICTPTLIEGVNTSAKNVIIFDNFKGRVENKLSSLDVKNIKGRAGRFLIHFIGKVITLEKIDESETAETIDFSYFDNPNLNSEESVQVEKSDLEGNNLAKREQMEAELRSLNIPIELIKKNKFISIENQIALIKFFWGNSDLKDKIYFANTLPDKNNLELIMTLCRAHLFNKRDKEDKSFTEGNLKRLVNYYVYKSPSLKELIAAQNGKTTDTKVRHAFDLIARYFEFALPKYFVAFENLYNFAYSDLTEKLNLKFLITKLEFGFVEPHEIALKEAGLPYGVIKKIEAYFKECKNIQDIRDMVSNNSSLLSSLTSYEKKIFYKYI